jgi:hypothetical protein
VTLPFVVNKAFGKPNDAIRRERNVRVRVWRLLAAH